MATRHLRRSGRAVLATAAILVTPLFTLAQRLSSVEDPEISEVIAPALPQAGGAGSDGTGIARDYNLAILNNETLRRIDDSGVRLELNLFRLDPRLLDSAGPMRYFVVLNNCKAAGNVDQRVVRVLDNELDFPKVAGFYKARSASILGNMPTTVSISLRGASLGPYDAAKQGFPILFGGGKFEFSNVRVDSDHNNLSRYCPEAWRQYPDPRTFPNTYGITFTPKLAFDFLPMDEASARVYIEHTNAAQRVIIFNVDLRILDSPPQISAINPSFTVANLKAEIEKITIAKGLSGEKVAVLYERDGPGAKAP